MRIGRNTNPVAFTESLHELRNYISFESKSVRLSGGAEHKLKLSDASDEWQSFVASMLGFNFESPTEKSTEGVRRSWMTRRVQVSRGIEYGFGNKAVYFLEKGDFPEMEFLNDFLDYEEAGHRWSISWFMLLNSMLCQLADTFSIYNRYIERHVLSESGVSELRRIAQEALEDLDTYYDVDIITSFFYRSIFERAKDSFGINSYYKSLTERLEMFSDSEIGDALAKSNWWGIVAAIALGIIAIGISVYTFLVTRPP